MGENATAEGNKVTINGGTFIGNIYAIVVSNWPNVLLNITGGNFEGSKSAMNISNRDDSITLSGGKFTATSTDEQGKVYSNSSFSQYFYGTKPTVTVGLIQQNIDDKKQQNIDKEEKMKIFKMR